VSAPASPSPLRASPEPVEAKRGPGGEVTPRRQNGHRGLGASEPVPYTDNVKTLSKAQGSAAGTSLFSGSLDLPGASSYDNYGSLPFVLSLSKERTGHRCCETPCVFYALTVYSRSWFDRLTTNGNVAPSNGTSPRRPCVALAAFIPSRCPGRCISSSKQSNFNQANRPKSGCVEPGEAQAQRKKTTRQSDNQTPPMPLCPLARMPVCPYARMPLWPYARMPACPYAPMPLCPYAPMPGRWGGREGKP
jgi:hypothetical protein